MSFMHTFIKILRTWKLPVAMTIGAILYFIVAALPIEQSTEDLLYNACSHYLQPTLIFLMLTLSFLKVSPHDLRPHRWHCILLLTQGALFVATSLAAYYLKQHPIISGPDVGGTPFASLLMQGAMLCFVCPTATASAVIVQKLGGRLSGCVTYLILCNLMVSVVAPGFLTLVEPQQGLDFQTSFFLIMGKVFPLLLCPLFVAMIIRHYLPRLTEVLLMVRDLAFYLWLVALALAITVTVRTIIESDIALSLLAGFAIISALCCCLQFWLGRKIGGADAADRITAGQAFGQKNTVFAIWMGLVFLNPVTSVVGGFYSVWHNIINSLQLKDSRK